jgi:hypothetical protein
MEEKKMKGFGGTILGISLGSAAMSMTSGSFKGILDTSIGLGVLGNTIKNMKNKWF